MTVSFPIRPSLSRSAIIFSLDVTYQLQLRYCHYPSVGNNASGYCVCTPNYGGESGLLTKIQVLWDLQGRRWVNVVLPDATKNRNNYLQVQAACLLGLLDPEHDGTATIRNVITIYRTTLCNSPEGPNHQATPL